MLSGQSLFENHLLTPSSENGAIVSYLVENSLATIIILIILGLITITVTLHRKHIPLIIQGIFSQRIISQLLREIKLVNERVMPIQMAVNIFIQSLFLFALFSLFLYPSFSSVSPYLIFVILFLLVIIDIFLKRVLSHLFLYLFDLTKQKDSFFLNKFLYYSINSVVLFPILILFFYTQIHYLLLLYVPLFLTSYLTLFYRLYLLSAKGYSKIHFFLYFCTIEVLPYFILIKVLFLLGN